MTSNVSAAAVSKPWRPFTAILVGFPRREQTGGHEIRGLGIVLDDENFHARFVSGTESLQQTQSNREPIDPPRGLAAQSFRVKE
jgi:hypothetical protein